MIMQGNDLRPAESGGNLPAVKPEADKAPVKSVSAARARTIKAQERMLAALAEGMTIKAAAKKAGINRDTYRAWRNTDLSFADRADAALVPMVQEGSREDYGFLGKVRDSRRQRIENRMEAAGKRLAFAAKVLAPRVAAAGSQDNRSISVTTITIEQAEERADQRRREFLDRLAKIRQTLGLEPPPAAAPGVG